MSWSWLTEGTMRTILLILALSVSAAAQGTPPEERLFLASHQVDLQVHENLAVLRVQIKVKNRTDRSLEGDLTFSTPPGAAVFGAALQKHIASTERRGRLLHPDQAAALYASDKTRQEEGGDETLARTAVGSGARSMAGGGGPAAPPPPPPGLGQPRGGYQGGQAGAIPPPYPPAPQSNSPVAGAGTPAQRPTWETNQGTGQPVLRITDGRNGCPVNGAPTDPALLEWISGDRYRLRFTPVPARDHQTVTFWVAFELTREGRALVFKAPLAFDSDFRTSSATRREGRISVGSSDRLGAIACASHPLRSIRQDEDGRRFTAAIDALDAAPELALAYEPGFWAKPGHALPADAAAGLRALRARQALEQAPEADRPAMGLASGIVSAYGSFLVIEKGEARDLARAGARGLKTDATLVAPATDDELRACGFVRPRRGAPSCEVHAVSTNDAAKIQWARDNGLTSGRSNGLLEGTSFEYVKHGAGCRVGEPNVQKLRQWAGSIK